MLVLPLHRPLNRANFPFVTMALVLVNAFVFLFLQSGDGVALQRAADYYGEADLAQIERPLYRDWRQAHPEPRLDAVMPHLDSLPAGQFVQLVQADGKFLQALNADALIGPQDPRHADWKQHRAEFEQLWQRQFDERHALRYTEFSPLRLISWMFLHHDFGHLFGNMLFLVVLGLLVEGGLGAGLFLALYLLAGIGAGLVSLAYRWGDVGGMVGASGAIAGLMGAYCVLWGMRKVRVFWWAFVAFGYSRITALWLLPFWLGWELLSLMTSRGSNVGFDAHAGGIVSGALLALGVRALGWEQHEFLDADEKADRAKAQDDALERALQHLGRLETRQAVALLEPLDRDGTPSLDVRIALYRCARYANQPAALRTALTRVIELPLPDAAAARKVKQIVDDYRKVDADGLALPPAQQLQLARAWLRIGADADAEHLARDLGARAADLPGLAELCWQLAQRAREGSPQWRARLQLIASHCPRSELASKAAFLLAQTP
ncbi:rhomboid family intramembrane serine protease [Tahibacter caeni]|uniref:rhomboid family intramembrane serine protease n=1 Tax=Tahibacter caeni TaxID=1453545 RepID=UPI0021481E40